MLINVFSSLKSLGFKDADKLEIYENKDINKSFNDKVSTTSKTSLLEAKVSGKVGVSVGSAANLSSKTVIEYDHIKVNAANVEVSGSLFLGLDVNITVPYPSLKW